jgi:hypothetical protein
MVPIVATVNGKGPGSDRLFASVAGRRFPSPISLVNEGGQPAEVALRLRPDSGAQVSIETDRFCLAPGERVETQIEAHTPSRAENDTVLEVVVDGVVAHEFRFTAVSLARESIFHKLGRT